MPSDCGDPTYFSLCSTIQLMPKSEMPPLPKEEPRRRGQQVERVKIKSLICKNEPVARHQSLKTDQVVSEMRQIGITLPKLDDSSFQKLKIPLADLNYPLLLLMAIDHALVDRQ